MSASALPDGHSGGAAESLRSTAFTNPFSPWLPSCTVSLTAACAGTRVKSSWYAPSRSSALARGVIAGMGRSDSRSMAQSSESLRRSVPYVSSVARSRSAW